MHSLYSQNNSELTTHSSYINTHQTVVYAFNLCFVLIFDMVFVVGDIDLMK